MVYNISRFLIFPLALFAVSFQNSNAQEAAYKKGELLIQLNDLAEYSKLAERFPYFKNIEDKIEEFKIVKVSFDPSVVDEQWLLSQVRNNPLVRNAQFNHLVTQRDSFPDDPNLSSQWGMHNTGQTGGINDADIDAPEAWSISTGGLTALGDTIVVAVIDGGFELSHSDLNFWKNYKDIPGNGIDDDGNGYIDDTYGWNAYDDNGNITTDSHGTHVAGIVGAKGNNAAGVTGVNWNVQVMPVMGSTGDEATAIKAYAYVLTQRKLYNQSNGDKGAFVVSSNASFGVDYGQPADFPLWCGIYDSLGAAGILNAGATANVNLNVDQQGDIPTACSSNYLVTVTNTTYNDVKSTNAGYGLTTIDLGAPGTNINSTVNGNSYQNKSGTSMATPHVAGAIGLMYAAACPDFIQGYKLNPATYALLMKNYLLNSTDPNSDLNGKTVSGGRLNLYKALLEVQDNCSIPVPPVAINDTDCVSGSFYLEGIVGANATNINWYNDAGGQSFIHSGDSLVTGSLAQTTTYYISSFDSVSGKESPLVPVTSFVINPQVTASTYILGSTQYLLASGAELFTWNPTTGLSCSDCSNPVVDVTDSTIYVVTGTDKYGCMAYDTILVVPNGIASNERWNSLVSVYPNPSEGDVIFEISNQSFSGSLQVCDITGKEIKRFENISLGKFVLSAGEVHPGMYFYKLVDENLLTQSTGRLVILK